MNIALVHLWKKRPKDRRTIENKILKLNENFIHGILNRNRNSKIPREDMSNEILSTIKIALERFDETRGTKFISYWAWWIQSKLQKMFTAYTKNKVGNNILNIYKQDVIDTFFKTNIPIESELVQIKDIKKLSECLTDRERFVIYNYYNYNISLRNIGKSLKISPEWVRNIKRESLYKMKVMAGSKL